MKIYPIDHKEQTIYKHYEKSRWQKYDWQSDGIIQKMIPESYRNSDNKIFQTVLSCIDAIYINVFRSIQTIENFTNIYSSKH